MAMPGLATLRQICSFLRPSATFWRLCGQSKLAKFMLKASEQSRNKLYSKVLLRAKFHQPSVSCLASFPLCFIALKSGSLIPWRRNTFTGTLHWCFESLNGSWLRTAVVRASKALDCFVSYGKAHDCPANISSSIFFSLFYRPFFEKSFSCHLESLCIWCVLCSFSKVTNTHMLGCEDRTLGRDFAYNFLWCSLFHFLIVVYAEKKKQDICCSFWFRPFWLVNFGLQVFMAFFSSRTWQPCNEPIPACGKSAVALQIRCWETQQHWFYFFFFFLVCFHGSKAYAAFRHSFLRHKTLFEKRIF